MARVKPEGKNQWNLFVAFPQMRPKKGAGNLSAELRAAEKNSSSFQRGFLNPEKEVAMAPDAAPGVPRCTRPELHGLERRSHLRHSNTFCKTQSAYGGTAAGDRK